MSLSRVSTTIVSSFLRLEYALATLWYLPAFAKFWICRILRPGSDYGYHWLTASRASEGLPHPVYGSSTLEVVRVHNFTSTSANITHGEHGPDVDFSWRKPNITWMCLDIFWEKKNSLSSIFMYRLGLNKYRRKNNIIH